MYKLIKSHLIREDFVHALAEVDTFVDINVEDLMELHTKAEKYARMRMHESMHVSELMSRSVKTVRHDSSLSDAAHLLVINKISGLPVIDADDKLVGIITEADFLRALGVPSHHPTHNLWQTLETLFSHHVDNREPDEKVSDLMVTDVVTVRQEQTLHDVLEVLKKNRIKRVIVTDSEHHVIGMITRSDLIRHFFDSIREPKSEAISLREPLPDKDY